MADELACRGARTEAQESRWALRATSRAFVWIASALVLCPGVTATHAQIAVSNGGTPTYSHAIGVPPGVGGMAPKLSLSYAGGGISGPVGLGWSIQGLSFITRCPATRATDGVISGVAYAPADKLCVDGQRLIQTDAAGTTLGTQIDDSRGLSAGVREYRTEKDAYARVRAHGVANGADINGPAYFKVWTKSGLIYEYGASPSADANSNALITAQGRNVAMAWAVTRISDTAGNYMDFKYEQRDVAWGSGPAAGPVAGRESNVVEIQYTGRPGQLPTNKVVFEYADRSGDRSEAYHQGSKIVSVRLLQAVRTYVNSPNPTVLGPAAAAMKVKTLKMTYQPGSVTGRSLVSAITECAGAAETPCLPVTTFTYSPGGTEQFAANANFRNSVLSTTWMHSTTGTYGVMTDDFNGDGRTDILRWADNALENQLWLSNGDGAFTQVPNGSGAGQFNITDQNLFKSDGCYASIAADFNGDGLPDFFRYTNAINPAGASCAAFGANYIYFAKGDGSFNRVQVTSPALERKGSKITTKCATANCTIEPVWLVSWGVGSTFYFLDVDGDGRPDIVTTTIPSVTYDRADGPPPDPCVSTVCTRVYKGNGDGSFTEIATNVANRSLFSDPAGGYELIRPTKTADIDGDGLTDLVGLSKRWSNSSVGWRSRGDGNFDPVGGATECFISTDFNGDQRFDCLAPPKLLASTGPALQQEVANFNLGGPGQELFSIDMLGAYTAGSLIADINGDGRQDILRWKDDPSQNVVYLSNGDGTFRQSSGAGQFNLNTGDRALQHSNGETGVVLGDFTGRGVVEILRLKHAPTTTSDATRNQLYMKLDSTPPDQLVSVRSATGSTTTLSYLPLSNAGSSLGPRYVSDRDAANTSIYPQQHLTLPTHVVTTQQIDSGVGGGVVTTEYRYKGLKADLRGRVLGFSEVRREGPGPNGDLLTVFTQYLQAHPYIGLASRTDTRRGRINDPTAQLLSTTTYIYCDLTALPGADGAATVGAPCPVPNSAKVQRPYLKQSTETGTDLNGAPLPTVTTSNTYAGAGDPTSVTVAITGTVAGIAETYYKTTTNTYYPDNTAGDNWILGRLQRATVRSQAPNSIGSLAASAGTAPNATATGGTKQALTVLISPSPISKSQASAGTVSQVATAMVSGYPTPPVTYSWTRTGGTTSLVSASPPSSASSNTTLSATLAAGQTASETWQVAVSDAVGRSGSASVAVDFSVPAASAPTVSVSPIALTMSTTTRGPVSGTVTATGAGGAPPYSYAWTRVTGSRITVSGTQTGTFSANVTYGDNFTESFRVTVTDANNMTASKVVDVTAIGPATPPALSINGVSPSAPSASRNNPGPISTPATVGTTGGATPFSYSWTRVTGSRITVSNANTATATFSASLGWNENLSETFRITVTDDAGQVASRDVTVTFTSPAAPSVSISPSALTITAPSPGTASGSVSASGAGGVAPYSYGWSRVTGSRILVSGGQSGSFSAGVTWSENFAERFQVTLTDSAGNTASQQIDVTAVGPTPPALTISLPASVAAYVGSGTATASATVTINSGGTGGLTYAWSQLSGGAISVTGAQTASFSGTPTRPQTNCDTPEPLAGTFRVAVQDSVGQVATRDIYVELYATEPRQWVPECTGG